MCRNAIGRASSSAFHAVVLARTQRWAARGLYRAVPWSEYDPGAKAKNKPVPEQQAFDFGLPAAA